MRTVTWNDEVLVRSATPDNPRYNPPMYHYRTGVLYEDGVEIGHIEHRCDAQGNFLFELDLERL